MNQKPNETKYIVRTNSWGNMPMYRGAKNLAQGRLPGEFSGIAVSVLKERGHKLVRTDGDVISHDLGAHEGWKAVFDATKRSTFVLFAS